jgi:hypothetical protein
MVWNSTLQDLDAWHTELIANTEGLSLSRLYKTWAGRWFIKYRYFKEVGGEVILRLAKNDGLSEEDIVGRLDAVRRSIPFSPSIQGLVDGRVVSHSTDREIR